MSRAERIQVYHGRELQPLAYPPIVASGAIWSRIRLEEIRAAPGQEVDASPEQHGVVLNVGGPFRWELTWSDDLVVQSSSQPTGCLAVFPAREHHHSRWFDESHVLVLEVDRSLLVEAADGAGHADPERVQLRRAMSCNDPFLRHLMLALRQALEAGERGSSLYGESFAVAIAMHLACAHATQAPPVASAGNLLPMGRMRRVAEYVHANLEATISLPALAQVAEMSVFHFSRLFKARAGVTPHQYVLNLRIDRAKLLLNDPSRTMGEIAAQCGFAHQQHFADAFRRKAGVTPTAYREGATPPKV